MKRRHLLKTGLAATALLATGVSAQEEAAVEPAIAITLDPMLAAVAEAHGIDQLRGEANPLAPKIVRVQAGIPNGEIHVDPNRFSLYWTVQDGFAIRYKVGIGRPGLYESGSFTVGAKREWPSWTPTPDMIRRNPGEYAQWADGMPGGPNNPLGARALYLFTPQRGDTYLRIHGTNLPRTIGTAVSNGCARLVNDEIIDLYNRVPMRTRVFLYPTS